MTSLARSGLPIELSTRPWSVWPAAASGFSWSCRKIRVAGLVVLAAATPAATGVVLSGIFVKCLCLAWLLAAATLMHLLGQRAEAGGIVLSIDRRGILDRRLMPRIIAWQEIEAICPVDVGRSHVVDLQLRWPEITLAGTRWQVRMGTHCQRGYGVPAVTISMLLLDGSVAELLAAVAQHRPDLLHWSNRQPSPNRSAQPTT